MLGVGAVADAGVGHVDILKKAFGFVVDAWLTVAGVIVHGAESAFGWIPGIGGKLDAAADAFDNFRDNVNATLGGIKDKTVTITYVTVGQGPMANKKIPLNASGTRNFGGGWSWVGEQGPELVSLPAGTDIYSNAESKQMMGSPSPASGGGAGNTYNITVQTLTAKAAGPLVVETIKEYERHNGIGWWS